MTPRDIRRAYLLVGFVIADIAMSAWEIWQARKRSKAWDEAIKKENDGVSEKA